MCFFVVALEVRFNQHITLIVRWEILKVAADAYTFWISIIKTALVQVVSNVHRHGVPSSILVVDKSNFSIVLQTSQDVVFLSIIVPQNNL